MPGSYYRYRMADRSQELFGAWRHRGARAKRPTSAVLTGTIRGRRSSASTPIASPDWAENPRSRKMVVEGRKTPEPRAGKLACAESDGYVRRARLLGSSNSNTTMAKHRSSVVMMGLRVRKVFGFAHAVRWGYTQEKGLAIHFAACGNVKELDSSRDFMLTVYETY
ncbi:predicted protein [Postia placenta Mad-698-R]|uniref:Uncharacterized protein n=1 Tax=Postia placenta MAD-698-R-SB12 TaxID=670580 RepID=A0A1X6MNP9_9APHY|nr:hypothetical protein POSPLADRAFT_1185451 [Postia placenta MAD-698-R-SB12]EED84087.1 predicted protein [Postia placenta Mad-698-R]OSX58005.1 hypothetical protein POSPLADRAFT_1185451 [Postia placenta MAD-698-R-SB12]